jgi:predicted SAM-dependent methyltransferase
MLRKIRKTVSRLLPLGGSPSQLAVRSRMANIGCGGTFHPAWDNFDLVPSAVGVMALDLVGDINLPDNSYEAVYCSHVLEHLPRNIAPRVCCEFHRILKIGGVLRLVVPDLEVIASNYVLALQGASEGDPQAEARHEWMTLEMLDQMTRSASGGFMGRMWWSRPLASRDFIIERLGQEATKQLEDVDRAITAGQEPLRPEEVYLAKGVGDMEEMKFRSTGEIHRWMYDRISLKRLLLETGFRDIRVCRPAESRIPGFAGYHLDTDAEGKVRKPDSLFMEAVK